MIITYQIHGCVLKMFLAQFIYNESSVYIQTLPFISLLYKPSLLCVSGSR